MQWFESTWDREEIDVQFEMTVGKDTIQPGTLIKFKMTPGTFKFRCLVYNSKLDKSWIDCVDVKRGSWRSFYTSKFKGVVKPKRTRRKKV